MGPYRLALYAAGFAVLLPGLASSQLTLVEPGFAVTTLPSTVGARQVECSPGGVWGDFVYVADTGGNKVERVDFFDDPEPFAGPFGAPMGLIFGPGPAGNFGSFLYVCNFGSSSIDKVDPSGAITALTSFPGAGSGSFDPHGAYGNAMFIPTAPAGPIRKVNPSGGVTTLWNITSSYLKFGPGGAWGNGMYSTVRGGVGFGIAQVSSTGTATLFSSGFDTAQGFDWAFGPGFGGDMFATDAGTGEIWRVKPDGSRTLWATLPGASDVAFCNGSLYVVGAQGDFHRVYDASTDARAPSWGAVKVRYR